MTPSGNAKAGRVAPPALVKQLPSEENRTPLVVYRQARPPVVTRRRALVLAASAGLVAVELVRDRLLDLAGDFDA